jgi:5-hydroxyisourate hydrolase
MITTHVLDTALGKPGKNVRIELERASGMGWLQIGKGVTDDDGRLRTLTLPGPVEPGTYRIRFETGEYCAANSQSCFFPVVEIHFTVVDGEQHYHVPLLLSPYGYSTYRGS